MTKTDALKALRSQLETAHAEIERAETVYSVLLAPRSGAPEDDILANIQAGLAALEAATFTVEDQAADLTLNQPLSRAFDADLRGHLMTAAQGWSFVNQPWPEFIAELGAYGNGLSRPGGAR